MAKDTKVAWHTGNHQWWISQIRGAFWYFTGFFKGDIKGVKS